MGMLPIVAVTNLSQNDKLPFLSHLLIEWDKQYVLYLELLLEILLTLQYTASCITHDNPNQTP